MRIVCPACETTYDVPDQVLAGGRPMRCARCRQEWVPVPATPALHPEPATAPTPDTAQSAAAAAPIFPDLGSVKEIGRAPPPGSQAPPEGARVGVIAAWLLSLIVLCGCLAAAMIWRLPIEHAWPPAIRVYSLLGYAR